MNIGIVSVWFECGAGYVTRQYKSILEKSGHKVFIFARGGHYPLKDPLYNVPEVTWSKPSHVPITYSFDLGEFKEWLKSRSIDVVFFNEQHWWNPVILCHELGIKTGSYIDYYTKDTIPLFKAYDFTISNTRRHFSVFKENAQSFYVPWGTDIETFKPVSPEAVNNKFVTYFHSCAATPERKGTDQLIMAFSRIKGPARLVIHTQVSIARQFPALKKTLISLRKNGLLDICNKTIGAPGLYHLGDIYVYPSRLEGIGLTMAEALASGLPLITTDYAPMNEFVDGKNGALIPVSETYYRKDNYYWPMCDVDIESLAQIMQRYADRIDEIVEMKKQARNFASEFLDWNKNRTLINDIFRNTRININSEKLEAINQIKSIEYSDSVRDRMYRRIPHIYSFAHRIYRMYRMARTKKFRTRVQ